MQKLKNATKLYITLLAFFVVVVALTLTLYFTLGAGRNSDGTGNGDSNGTVESLTTAVLNGSSTLSSSSSLSFSLNSNGTTTPGSAITIKNMSKNLPIYVRAQVVLAMSDGSTTAGMYITSGDGWTYASDNYLYYRDALATNAITSKVIDAIHYPTSYSGKSVKASFIVEAIQEEAGNPNVAFSGVTVSNSSNFSNGMLNKTASLTALASKTDTKTLSIANNGKQDLDVKLRMASSKWTVSQAKIGSTSKTIERDDNSGYYHILEKLPIGSTLTLILADADKNNSIVAPSTTIEFILQDYAVANDFYSLVDGNMQNLNIPNETKTISKTNASGLKVYSYNNLPKYVYVQTATSNNSQVQYADGWGFDQGGQIAISSTPIAPKSYSGALFDSTWLNGLASGVTLTIKVWSADTVVSPTVQIIKGASVTDTEFCEPVATSSGTTITSSNSLTNLMIDLSSVTNASSLSTTLKNTWGNLRIKGNDFSDLLVRASISFVWGTNASGSWVPDEAQPALGFDPSIIYGAGFSYNSEDESLAYAYNLPKGYVTSPMLDFSANGTIVAQALLNAKESSTNDKLKLNIMIEAVYAEGSQLDVLDMSSATKVTTSNFYALINGATSMVDGQKMVTYAKNGTINWNNYSIYIKNNFPVGVRVSLAIEYGSLSGSTWTPATESVSAINLSDYIDSSNWVFDADLGGYKYNSSLPGKCATLPLFTTSGLSSLKTAIDAEIGSNSHARLVIMVESTHRV